MVPIPFGNENATLHRWRSLSLLVLTSRDISQLTPPDSDTSRRQRNWPFPIIILSSPCASTLGQKQRYPLPIFRRVEVFREPGTTRQTSFTLVPAPAELNHGESVKVFPLTTLPAYLQHSHAEATTSRLQRRDLFGLTGTNRRGLIGLTALYQLPDTIFYPKVRTPNSPIIQLSNSVATLSGTFLIANDKIDNTSQNC